MRTKNSDFAFVTLIAAAELAQLMGYTGATNAFRTFLFKAGIKPVPGARGKYDPKVVRCRLDEIQGLTEKPQSATAAPLSLVQQRRARNAQA